MLSTRTSLSDDAELGLDPANLRLLLRNTFETAGDPQDDWDTYDRTMVDERRTAILITPNRVYTNPG